MKETKATIIKLTNQQMTQTLGDFYDSVMSNIICDCKYITVAPDVQDAIYEGYKIKYPKEYAKNPEGLITEVTMKLAMAGPKVDKDLEPGTVAIFDGFFKPKEEEK